MLCSTLALLSILITTASANPTPVKRFSGVKIQSYRSRKCLSPVGDNFYDGLVVTTVDCGSARTWDINPGSGSVILHGNGKALDAGTGRDNNEGVKIWTSYPTLFQQTWFVTGDARIAITGGDQCLDEGDNGPQTYRCTTGNTNQIWYILDGGNPPPPASSSVKPSASSVKPSASASSVKPSASASASSTSSGPRPSQSPVGGGVYKDPSNVSRRIHPNGKNNLCVTADNGNLAKDVSVNLAFCQPNNSTISTSQLWNIAAGSTNDFIRSASNPDLCLDVGNNPGSGSRVFVTPCAEGSDHKKWTYMADKIKVSNRNLCLDLEQSSGPRAGSPLNTEGDLQVWECFTGNTQQVFTLYPL